MGRQRTAEAEVRWQRLVQSCAQLAVKTVTLGGSKRLVKHKASAVGTMTSEVTHSRGLRADKMRAMDGIPGSMDSQVE